MSVPSEVAYEEYAQMPGCTVEVRAYGDRTIRPACLGGVGMVGCVRRGACADIAWAPGGNDEIATLLADLHAVNSGGSDA